MQPFAVTLFVGDEPRRDPIHPLSPLLARRRSLEPVEVEQLGAIRAAVRKDDSADWQSVVRPRLGAHAAAFSRRLTIRLKMPTVQRAPRLVRKPSASRVAAMEGGERRPLGPEFLDAGESPLFVFVCDEFTADRAKPEAGAPIREAPARCFCRRPALKRAAIMPSFQLRGGAHDLTHECPHGVVGIVLEDFVHIGLISADSEPNQAQKHLEAAVDLYRQARAPNEAAGALRQPGQLYRARGDLDASLEAYEEALDAIEERK